MLRYLAYFIVLLGSFVLSSGEGRKERKEEGKEEKQGKGKDKGITFKKRWVGEIVIRVHPLFPL